MIHLFLFCFVIICISGRKLWILWIIHVGCPQPSSVQPTGHISWILFKFGTTPNGRDLNAILFWYLSIKVITCAVKIVKDFELDLCSRYRSQILLNVI